MSDTPETDDEIRTPEMPPGYLGEREIVDASFARRLERERDEAQGLLREALEELYELKGERDWWKDEPRGNHRERYDALCELIERIEKQP
jgi:myo-inositol catabolism protein IolC